MKFISIGEIQKNISIFNNLNEIIQIIDKRKKKVLATIYPNKTSSITHQLAGKYRNYAKKGDLKSIKEEALKEAFGEKYGFSH